MNTTKLLKKIVWISLNAKPVELSISPIFDEEKYKDLYKSEEYNKIITKTHRCITYIPKK